MGPVSRRQFVEPRARRVSSKKLVLCLATAQRYHSLVLATNRPTCSSRGGGTAEPYSESFVKVAGSGCRGSGVCDADTPSQRLPRCLCAGSLRAREDERAVLLRHGALDLGTRRQLDLAHQFLGPALVARAKNPVPAGRHALVARHEDRSRLGVQAGVADGASCEELDHSRAGPLHWCRRGRRWGRGRRRLRSRNGGRRQRRLLSGAGCCRACPSSGLWLSDGR